MPDESDYGSLVLSLSARRAWAVEQAVAIGGWAPTDPERMGAIVLAVADQLLNYLEVPQRTADARLLAAARRWDGTGEASPLIGALADALERIERGG